MIAEINVAEKQKQILCDVPWCMFNTMFHFIQMLVPFQDTPVEVEQNTDLPEYLPEDESPSKEQDKAVSRVGSHPEGAASWLSTAANFLSRSFYWWLWIKAKGLCQPTGGSFSIILANCQVQFAISYRNRFFRLHKIYTVFYILLDILAFWAVRRWKPKINVGSFPPPTLCFIS